MELFGCNSCNPNCSLCRERVFCNYVTALSGISILISAVVTEVSCGFHKSRQANAEMVS